MAAGSPSHAKVLLPACGFSSAFPVFLVGRLLGGARGSVRHAYLTCAARAAAVAWGPGVPLSLEEVEVAPPGPMEVRVKVLFTSICHTDVRAWKGDVHYIHSCYACR